MNRELLFDCFVAINAREGLHCPSRRDYFYQLDGFKNSVYRHLTLSGVQTNVNALAARLDCFDYTTNLPYWRFTVLLGELHKDGLIHLGSDGSITLSKVNS